MGRERWDVESICGCWGSWRSRIWLGWLAWFRSSRRYLRLWVGFQTRWNLCLRGILCRSLWGIARIVCRSLPCFALVLRLGAGERSSWRCTYQHSGYLCDASRGIDRRVRATLRREGTSVLLRVLALLSRDIAESRGFHRGQMSRLLSLARACLDWVS